MVPHRYRHAAHALLILFAVLRIATGAGLRQRRQQRLAGRSALRGKQRVLIAFQQRVFLLRLAQPGDRDLTDRRCVDGKPTADARVGDGGEPAFDFLDVDAFVAVRMPEVSGLPGALREIRQPAFRLLANIHRPYDKMAAFSQLHAQAVFVVFRILIDIAVQL